jgi:hypothetical protein
MLPSLPAMTLVTTKRRSLRDLRICATTIMLVATAGCGHSPNAPRPAAGPDFTGGACTYWALNLGRLDDAVACDSSGLTLVCGGDDGPWFQGGGVTCYTAGDTVVANGEWFGTFTYSVNGSSVVMDLTQIPATLYGRVAATLHLVGSGTESAMSGTATVTMNFGPPAGTRVYTTQWSATRGTFGWCY